jgi:hypothetical protein
MLHLLTSPCGTPRRFAAVRRFGRDRRYADIDWLPAPIASEAYDRTLRAALGPLSHPYGIGKGTGRL